MNVEELKKLVKHSTAVLVLDNGEPSFVILNYDMYKDLVLGGKEKEIKINHNMANGNGLSPERSHEGSQHASASYGMNHSEEKVVVKPALPDNELDILERINKDILALKNEIEKEEKLVSID